MKKKTSKINNFGITTEKRSECSADVRNIAQSFNDNASSKAKKLN